MIRLLLFSFLLLPVMGHAQGTFMFTGEPADQPAARPSRAPYPVQGPDDEEVVEDTSWVKNFEKRKARPVPPVRRPRPTVVDDDTDTESQPPCRNCSPQRRPTQTRITVSTRVVSTPSNMRTPVWPTFARNFEICAPGCQPARMGIHRPEDGRRSCHHSNRAIDVGAMICGGRAYTAYTSRFGQMVACMRRRMPTIYQQWHKRARYGDTQAHFDHAHFSIRCYGGTFY
jgi:hypothetical protein